MFTSSLGALRRNLHKTEKIAKIQKIRKRPGGSASKRPDGDKKGCPDAVVWRPDAQFLAPGRQTRVKTPPPARFEKIFLPKTYK